MNRMIESLLLPSEITSFERSYLERMNKIALVFFLLHVPAMTAIAALNGTSPLRALLLSTAVVTGPALARSSLSNPRSVSIVHGIAAMFMGGLLVHFGQGPMQIEMHFYFFALLAMCAMFGNPMVIVAAAVTVALHHLVVWLVLPRSVFNYDASAWVVVVHAAFVVLESVAACFISRSFFDNVIGLEKIVEARTAALDVRNREMRMLLDNVEQGFMTISTSGEIAPERSAAVDRWFGAPTEGATWFDFIGRLSPDFAENASFAWLEVTAGIMPLELTLEQMPHRLVCGEKTFDVAYKPVGVEPHDRYLVIVSDITSRVKQERADCERLEAMALFEHVLVDRTGTEAFLEEGTLVVDALARAHELDSSAIKRMVHTLKGNASLMGVTSVATLCHDLEELMAQERIMPAAAQLAPLKDRWSLVIRNTERLLGKRGNLVQIANADFEALLSAARSGESREALVARVVSLKLEPVDVRLKHFGDQAKRIADRLEKPELEVRVKSNGVRLDPKRWAGFWATFVHAIRNAVDHGIESPHIRLERGKAGRGVIELSTCESDESIVVEVSDDGNGIDWDAIRERAARFGMPARSAADLNSCLFADGVSTAASVTELSGRGVGMGALLHATRSLGGELDVRSVPGKGTRLRMTFPRHAGAQTNASSAAA